MICVTIGRGRHSSLAEEWKAVAEAGAELVEVRADCLRRDPDLKRILKVRPTPLVFTARRGSDGGLWRGSEEKRQQLLREAIALGVDYIDLEIDVADKIRRFGPTKRIVSFHNQRKTPEELPDLAERCAGLDADVVKVATLASTLGDASRVLRIASRAKVPTIAIAMGEIGFFTRVLGAKYGAPFTYAGFNLDRVFAPAMPFFQELKRDYCYDQIDAQTEVYAVIGDPIAQSLSPAVHNAAFRHLGLNKVLVPVLVPADSLDAFFNELDWLGIRGFSVTIPHKESLLNFLDQRDEVVERIGSCNTVVVQDGRRSGSNSDYQAAMDTLERTLGGDPASTTTSMLLDKQVLILGAGGVARTIAFGLLRRGAGVTIVNRHDERAGKLAEELGCRSTSWAMRAGTISDILINCTPVGMHPYLDDTPVPPAAFRAGTLVFDTVYHPENTMFLKLARERGCTTISGVEMFVQQAARQFQLYTGHAAPIDLMRDVLRRKLAPIRDT
jgi:3-dehydroquinate dehydratase/shikimate dehydrogenase